MLTPETKLIVSGSIAKDTIKVVRESLLTKIRDAHPTFSVSLLIDDEDVKDYRGGTGANIVYTLGLLGIKPILLAATSATDEAYLTELNQLGINTNHVHRSQRRTSHFEVITDIENNQMATFLIGAMGDSESLTLLPWKNKKVFAIIAPHDPKMMQQQVEECIQHGIPYCFDFGQQVNNSNLELIRKGSLNAAVLVANDYEMQILAQRIGITSAELKLIVPLYITTYGKEGAVIEGAELNQPIHIPAAPVAKVVDPTGAGDAWRAGFFAGLTQGKSIQEAGYMGAVTAAYAVEHKGGQEHRFTSEEFETRLAEYKRSLS